MKIKVKDLSVEQVGIFKRFGKEVVLRKFISKAIVESL